MWFIFGFRTISGKAQSEFLSPVETCVLSWFNPLGFPKGSRSRWASSHLVEISFSNAPLPLFLAVDPTENLLYVSDFAPAGKPLWLHGFETLFSHTSLPKIYLSIRKELKHRCVGNSVSTGPNSVLLLLILLVISIQALLFGSCQLGDAKHHVWKTVVPLASVGSCPFFTSL